MAAFLRVTDGHRFGLNEGLDVLTPRAREVLVGVARTFPGLITYKTLSDQIQESSGLRTEMGLQNWIGQLLSRVVHEAHRRGEPALTALVVHASDGMVGKGYAEVLSVAGEAPVEDENAREQHAAAARFECYRHFGAVLPDGAGPILAPKLAESLARQRAKAPRPPRPMCQECFMELPANGACSCV